MNLQECAYADPVLADRPAVLPLTDFGPEWIDAETVTGMANQVQSGTVEFAYDPSDLVDATENTVLNALFVTYLNETPLTSPYALPHRVLALVRAIKHLVEASDGPTAATLLDPHTVTLSETTLELWLYKATQALPERFTAEQRALLRDEVMLLTVKEVAQLTGISFTNLQQYRLRNIGPQYVKVGTASSSVRYPAAAVLGWLYGYQKEETND